MSKQWLREHKKDHFYKEAKRTGHRSRASFKLMQINKRFKLFKKGNRVVDLGAAPGGWSQVAKELVGEKGTVVAVDLVRIEPIEGVIFIQGDMTAKTTREKVLEEMDVADIVISDMSPKLSGNYSMDQARSAYLVEHALDFAIMVLRPGGNFVTKIFEGEDFPDLLKEIRDRFNNVKVFSPEASRKSSSEVYIVARGFKGRRKDDIEDELDTPDEEAPKDAPEDWV